MAKTVNWYFNVSRWLPSSEQWLKLTSCIAREEVERINKFAYQEDSKSSLIGCALIVKFLSHISKSPANQEIRLTRTRYGRPVVCEESLRNFGDTLPKMFDFNVSHSGDYCVLAGVWSDTQHPEIKVGIDVTKIVKKKSKQELDRFLSLMSRREFTRAEWETVEKVPSDRQKCINFTRLWCLKESFIKSIGLGLSFKLSRIEFNFDNNRKYDISTEHLNANLLNSTKVLLDGRDAKDWLFIETALDDEHLVAIGYNVEADDQATTLHSSLGEQASFVEVTADSLVNSIKSTNEQNVQDWTVFSKKNCKQHLA